MPAGRQIEDKSLSLVHALFRQHKAAQIVPVHAHG